MQVLRKVRLRVYDEGEALTDVGTAAGSVLVILRGGVRSLGLGLGVGLKLGFWV